MYRRGSMPVKMDFAYLVVGLIFLCGRSYGKLCSDGNKDIVARIVFGEARGESLKGQLAVAYTVVNRVSHPGFPDDVVTVAYQKTTSGKQHQYETLDHKVHETAYQDGKQALTEEYRNALQAAGDALCGTKPDPTKGQCAVNFCALDPCASTNSNPWWEAYNKDKIGNHHFVCLRPQVK